VFNPNHVSARAALAAYRDLRPSYVALGEYVAGRVRTIAERLDMRPMISARAQSLERVAEALQRRRTTEGDPLKGVSNLCSVRVVTHTLDELAPLAEALAREFDVQDEAIDGDAGPRSPEFTQRPRHLGVQLRESLPPGVVPDAHRAMLTGCRIDVRLRTLTQHVWAVLFYELGHRNEFVLPPRWRREFNRLAALLECCDEGFQRIKGAIRVFESSPGTWGAYMSPHQLQQLSARLETLFDVMSGDAAQIRITHRLIRAYLSLGEEEKLRALLSKVDRSAFDAYPAAMRDAGIALCKTYAAGTAEYDEGVSLLSKARTLNPPDVDALSSLAGRLKRGPDRAAAAKLYEEAHLVDPTNPYPLGNYIAEELLRRSDATILPYFRVSIDGAISRCLQHVDARVNFPWSLFDLGLLHLYKGEPEIGLAYYARGVDRANESWMIATANSTIKDLLNADIKLEGLVWVDKLLSLAAWTRGAAAATSRVWQPSLFSQPVVIVAGGCGGMEALYRPRLDELTDALRTYRGTMIGGGTRSGVAAIPGELQERVDRRRRVTVAYLPARTGDVPIDTRYSYHRRTKGAKFSVLEPLKFWEDVAAAGGDPRAVRLIGFNGGAIAACEYRIALALGGHVGIIDGSGREADRLLSDTLWKAFPRLERLRSEGDIRAFLDI